ncbi:electron transfer flavo protein beta-subunit [Sphaerosporella brunnea]|uniref:Probable electron transfer flavoprotein subunit beta n=1 Tax=Sphaerosporella brunnea TaxID=1250544 RepID=A0A5J5EK61_9PEZI|nr:electron transfer flavo protein beta-subunit [Sphaerosporella brunnea]KAA8896056.1 electron transfer flavo protein beta-subunit [Sphaerosporella brunnea]
MSALRILVPIKRVLDYAIKPRIAASGKAIDLTGQKMSLNPFDELSIEASVRLREEHKTRIEDILAFSAGPQKSQDALRTAMAMGADRGLLVDTATTELEPLAVAKILKRVVEKEKSNLVILGKQSIDDDAGQTGQMLAGLLGWGQATQAADIKLEGDTVTVVKEVDGGTETVKGKLPMVVTTDLRLNEPRYASLPNIMKAKKKKLEQIPLKDYGEGLEGRLEVLQLVEPPPRQGGGKVADVSGMISKLKELGAL